WGQRILPEFPAILCRSHSCLSARTDLLAAASRSLITAGVPSIIVSLWKVPDEQTAFLMTEFYKNLQKSPDKAQALRQAMLTTRQNYPDPLNWAAFTLIGEAD
ncbi:MAG: CHAT domain-containing protein, partial [Leptolyngbyaceae cyanobacterium CAN_BIN12]|nr:CHAT domain-containing protein [Leptolyngbyaceae cyanobacterium CAN_BIN12]